MEKIEILQEDLHVLDELVRLSKGSYNRTSLLHCVILHYQHAVESALDYLELRSSN
jgi:hypothetical protein